MMFDARSWVTNPAGNWPLDRDAVIGISVHHSVTSTPATATAAQEQSAIRAIDSYHVGLSYGGIGYHVVVFPSGRAYQVGSFDGARSGVAFRNSELIHVCAIGTFTDVLPGQVQLQGIAEAILAVRGFYGRPLEIRGHNQWAVPGQGTICAGRLNGFDWRPYLESPVYTVERILLALQAATATTWMHQSPDFVPPWDREVLRDVYGR